jgi:hypothetical protein
MFSIPPKSEVGVLSPEIAGEGQQIMNSQGEIVNWNPPPQRLVMPDWSQIKKIQKYFNRKDHSDWPSYIYNKDTGETRIMKNAEEAAQFGIGIRKRNEDEAARFGAGNTWDWEKDSPWRPQPSAKHVKPDPKSTGKILVETSRPQVSMEQTVAAVVAAVTERMKGQTPSAPSNVSNSDWDEFQRFIAFKKASELTGMEKPEKAVDGGEINANALSDGQEKNLWIEEATSRGIKVDKRWSVDRIKAEVEKAA